MLAIVGLLLMLIALYEVSSAMNARLSLLSSQIEGERVVAQLGRTVDGISIAGPGSHTSVRLYSYPPQTIILNGSVMVARSADNQTVAFLENLANVSNNTFDAVQTVDVTNKASGLFVEGRGS